VPYRDFNQALVDLAEGRIDAAASGLAPMLPHANSGKIKLIAFINPERATVAPNVPTLIELGYAEFSFRAVTGFFGWRDMPDELAGRIAADVREIAADLAVRERLSKMGSVALRSTPAEFAKMIEDQRLKVVAIDRLLKTK
jgi:tripartite-type tricarboxylate transporter receptor subunit TctC